MKAAFFKGDHKGWRGYFGRAVRMWTLGRYSHVELVFSDGQCGSSLYLEGGVRYRKVDFSNTADWDFVELPDSLEKDARNWFDSHIDKAYDFLGDFHFIVGAVAASRDKWFCSRAVADALGLEDGWRYEPNVLASALKLLSASNK